MATELIKAHLLPPIITSGLSRCQCPVQIYVVCRPWFHTRHTLLGQLAGLALRIAAGSCWNLLFSGDKLFYFFCLSCRQYLFMCYCVRLQHLCQTCLKSDMRFKSLPESGVTGLEPEELMSELGDPAVLYGSQICVFWVIVLNFTVHSIQNSWEIPLEIRNSLGISISSSFSLQGIKAM